MKRLKQPFYFKVLRKFTKISSTILQNFNISGLFGPHCVFFWVVLFTLWISTGLTLVSSLVVAFCSYLVVGGWRFQRVMYLTMRRDLKALYIFIQCRLTIFMGLRRNETVGSYFHKLVLKHPNKTCFLFKEESWTFNQVEEYANKIGNCFSELGYRPGDDIALFMESGPEYVATWLGLSRIGVVPALINTNLRNHPLAHCVTVINCKAMIFGSEMSEAVKELGTLIKDRANMKYYCKGKFETTDYTSPVQSLDMLLAEAPTKLPTCHKGNFNDHLFYIYTSGTTGLPKAAIIRHSRYVWLGTAPKYFNGIREDDILYTALPLYHTASGVIAVCQCIVYGNTLAIRSKFSASKFWEDCIKYNCTVSHYIGELCRYLLAQPERPMDHKHKVRLMFGNGLRPQIWKSFVQRFGIKQIGELYGSTEGNANVVNIDNVVGSCGFISRIIPTVYPVALIKVDPDSGEPIRTPEGLCITCNPGEVGEFVGKIIVNDPARSFDGYLNSEATQKKIGRNVFRKGDMAFLTGDLLTMDELGNLFFVDRTGDTYRWRGENISTTEVEGMISNVLGLSDCVCYGVEVPEVEGKAGMLAILDENDSIDLNLALKDMKKVLPPFALPLFIRKVAHLERTSTYKFKKMELKKEGYNPHIVNDKLFILQAGQYVRLDKEIYKDLQMGHVRL